MRILLTFLLVLGVTFVFAQDEKGEMTLPSVEVTKLDGEVFNTSEIDNDGNPIIISFWATWCKPCIKELTTIADVYEDWQDETGVKLIAVSIDDARFSSKVQPLVDGNSWDYEVLLDQNHDFKRAMNVNMIPHTFIVDGNGNIVWQHTTFTEGGELEIIELVTKLKNGESIEH